MKKVIVLALVVALGGCAQLQKVTIAVRIASVGVANPVTKQDLYNFENGMIIAFAGLNAYKRVCVAGTIPASCKDTIRSIQVYTRQLPPLLAQARSFVKSGDQVNAKLVYNTLLDLYDRAKTIATANNVKVQ
jgi:hypothetical protein